MIPDPNLPQDLSPQELLELQITARLLGELPPSQSAALDEAVRLHPELAQLEARLRRALPWIQAACHHPATSAQPATPPSSSPSPDLSSAPEIDVAAEARRSAFLHRLRQENPPSPFPLPNLLPPSQSLPSSAPTSPGILSLPSLRWLALAAGLVALFFVVSSSLQPRQLQLTSFDLALDGAPTATSLGVPFTMTNRDLLRRRPNDFGAFVVTTEGSLRKLGIQPTESVGELVSRPAAGGRFSFAENTPATPSSAPVPPAQAQNQDQVQQTHWNFSANRGGSADPSHRDRLAETTSPPPEQAAGKQVEGLPITRSASPAEPPITAGAALALTDKSMDHGGIAGPPRAAPISPTRRSEPRGRPLQPEPMSLSTFADFDADSGAQLMESESLERRPSSDTRNHVSSRTLATQDSLSYQPPVIGDAASLEDLFVQEDRQERFLNSHVTALGRSLGELPELQTTPPQLTPPPTIFFPPETLTTDQPLSTFSLNVADVSFQLAAASLAQGQLPPPHTIRTEEFINALHYRDPEPPQGAPVGFAWDRARYPFTQQRDVLRLAVRTAAIGRHARQPLHVILVVDASGSMERADRIATLHAALHALASQLGPADRLSAVTFARTARLVIDGVHGNDAPRLVERLLQTVPEGGTHLEEALRLGYQTALQHFIPGGVNRLILFTDGAANLGELQNAELQSIVETHRRRGIALDTFGIGWDGYDDERLAALARHGDGRYGFLNSPDDVASRFVRQLTGALEVAASDVKVQVEFHPDRVASWRQVGYAQHQLTAEQFRDDTVDAAELGAAESGNALYLIETLPQGSGPIATVRVRFRQPSSGIITEHTWAVPYTGLAPDLAEASPALRLAVAAAGLGERLSGNPLAAGISIPNLQDLMRNVAEWYHPDPAPARLQLMLQQAAPLLSP